MTDPLFYARVLSFDRPVSGSEVGLVSEICRIDDVKNWNVVLAGKHYQFDVWLRGQPTPITCTSHMGSPDEQRSATERYREHLLARWREHLEQRTKA